MTTINEIMKTNLFTLPPSSSLFDAVSLMNMQKIRHIPIVDNELLVGLLTQRDALTFMHKDEQEQKTIQLADIMRDQVITVEATASIRKAGLFLQKHKLGCLPVVDGKTLVGIVTDTDFVSVAINLLEQMESVEPLEDEF